MLSRSTLSRGISQCCAKNKFPGRRGMAAAAAAAAAASDPFHFSISDASGIKVASRDDGGPTTSLALVVRGGSRYQPAPGLAHGLTNFAFKNTTKRTALRMQREAELLGGVLNPSFSRENIILGAKFLRQDLPFFVEVLADVVTKTKYIPHEFTEEVAPQILWELEEFAHNPSSIALETAHNVAFHTGLGAHRLSVTNKYVSNLASADTGPAADATAADKNSLTIPAYAKQVYQKGNVAVVASGASHSELEKWTSEFFADLPAGNGPPSAPSKYHGGENRVYSPFGNALVIAFPGSQKAQAEYTVLSHLLGGVSSTKWNAGTSLLSKVSAEFPGVSVVARHAEYSDAGLLTITITGPQGSLRRAAESAVKALNEATNPKQDDVKKAIAQAKFDALAAAEDRTLGLELVGQRVIASGQAPQVESVVKSLEGVTAGSIKKTAQSTLGGKATFSAVGDLHFLPFASDVGLKV